MVEKVLYMFAFALLLGFLAILFFKVPRIDLGLVIAVTLLLAGRDLFQKESE